MFKSDTVGIFLHVDSYQLNLWQRKAALVLQARSFRLIRDLLAWFQPHSFEKTGNPTKLSKSAALLKNWKERGKPILGFFAR